jgi:hypothetical protein
MPLPATLEPDAPRTRENGCERVAICYFLVRRVQVDDVARASRLQEVRARIGGGIHGVAARGGHIDDECIRPTRRGDESLDNLGPHDTATNDHHRPVVGTHPGFVRRARRSRCACARYRESDDDQQRNASRKSRRHKLHAGFAGVDRHAATLRLPLQASQPLAGFTRRMTETLPATYSFVRQTSRLDAPSDRQDEPHIPRGDQRRMTSIENVSDTALWVAVYRAMETRAPMRSSGIHSPSDSRATRA